MKVNIEGIKDEDDIQYTYYDGTGSLPKNIKLQNGEILLPESKIGNPEEVSSNLLAGFDGIIVGDNTVTITLLPEYEGALVFDGVDDYISLEAFDSGFKTIFVVLTNFTNKQCFMYDQRIVENFAIRYDAEQIAYLSRSNKNPTYINGKLNSTIKHIDLLNKKHLINITSSTYEGSDIIPCIGAQRTVNDNNAKISLYKFLGFKEALTEEQIQYVIKKYNLLDGVDEIEVS